MLGLRERGVLVYINRVSHTSTRTIPCVKSEFSLTALAPSAEWKLGHPVPESNFVLELKSFVSQHMQW